jgi:hypothetical protein
VQRAGQALTLVGAYTPDRLLYGLRMSVNYLRLGRWMRTQGFRFPTRLGRRKALYEHVGERIANEKVLYLEFGVHKGASIRQWAEILRHPDAQLHGFDSFLGLPEDWDPDGGYPKGRFSTGGVPPEIDDPRVTFHVGWFADTLPEFELPEHDVLVVNVDADLYSSTIFVLRELRAALRPGSRRFFDDLSRPDDEAKAFGEFMQESGLRFRAVAATQPLSHACFECVG